MKKQYITKDNDIVIRIRHASPEKRRNEVSTQRSAQVNTSENEVSPFPFKDPGNITYRADIQRKPSLTSYSSESAISVVKIHDKLPPPNIQNQENGCTIEVNVIEKHDEQCKTQKGYDPGSGKILNEKVLGKLVIPTCANTARVKGFIQNSPKGFNLSNSSEFRKPLTENRSKIDVTPILPIMHGQQSNVVLRTETVNLGNMTNFSATPTCEIVETPLQQIITIKNLPRTNVYNVDNDYVSYQGRSSTDGKIHYPGDSGTLEDPDKRRKQIHHLQEVLEHTKYAINVSQSKKSFLEENKAIQVPSMTYHPVVMAATVGPKILPHEPMQHTEPFIKNNLTQTSSDISNASKKEVFVETSFSASIDSINLHPETERNSATVKENFGKMFDFLKKKPPSEDGNSERIYQRAQVSGREATHSSDQPTLQEGKPRTLATLYRKLY